MRPCSSSGMDRRILLYTRFPAGVVRLFDGTTRFRRLFSVGSCFWFSNGSPETLRTLCDKPASLFLGASWGQLSLTPNLFKLCRHELSKSMPQRSRWLLVQDNPQQGSVDIQPAIILNEAQF